MLVVAGVGPVREPLVLAVPVLAETVGLMRLVETQQQTEVLVGVVLGVLAQRTLLAVMVQLVL
jgi:hypothetical protein